MTPEAMARGIVAATWHRPAPGSATTVHYVTCPLCGEDLRGYPGTLPEPRARRVMVALAEDHLAGHKPARGGRVAAWEEPTLFPELEPIPIATLFGKGSPAARFGAL